MGIYGSKDDDGRPIELDHLLVLDEHIKRLSFFGGLMSIPARWAQTFSTVQVRFNGPLLVGFRIKMPLFGDFFALMPLTPIEPFVTHMEFWGFAGPRWPWPLAYIMTRWVYATVNQDREVWEHRTHPNPRNAVKGDYSWSKYDNWLGQFYSPSSILYHDDLAW